MDKSQVKRIVRENIQWMRYALQLNDWTIDIQYGPIEDRRDDAFFKSHARCTVKARYRKANIEIDPEPMEDEDEVLRALRHELMHILHAEFQTFTEQANAILSDGQRDILDAAWNHGAEMLIGNLERMFDLGLGLPPKKMIEMAKHGRQPIALRNRQKRKRR